MPESAPRREFLKTSTLAGLGALALPRSAFAQAPAAPASSALRRVRLALVGTNSRGATLAREFSRLAGVEVAWICDPDDEAITKGVEAVQEVTGNRPRGEKDFRRLLDGSEVDAMVMATPDHWHAPGAILAMQAGKHVYLEKPISHNPAEGEMVAKVEQRSGVVFQMGNQRRSGTRYHEAIAAIHGGIIGRPYLGKTWYTNRRGPIGRGKLAPVPAHLDYELWQGPAPRRPFRDNVIHYNWHWFELWGTGELNNNATHEVDVCRWALQVDFPTKVTSGGGRFHYDDDWEFYDTQDVAWEFANGSMITWSGRSCNPTSIEGGGRGVVILGTEGSARLSTDAYRIYNLDNELIAEAVLEAPAKDDTNTTNPDTDLTSAHAQNFIDAIRGEAKPNSPAEEGHRSNLLCHLGNIAQKVGRTLHCDPRTGRILNDAEAMASWQRTYEPGWAPRV